MNINAKFSRYNYKFEHGKGAILYNSFTTNLVVLDEVRAARFTAADMPAKLDAELFEYLYKRGYVVDCDKDELAEVGRRHEFRKNGGSGQYNVVLQMNKICNFACSYCYQGDKDAAEVISHETLDKIASYITKDLAAAKRVIVHFFGGEPSLTLDKVYYFADMVKSATNVHFAMTTNGYRLEESEMRSLIACGVTKFQITLDGNPEAHNAQRVTRNGEPTYARILSNISKLLEHGAERITVRVNVTRKNWDKLDKLLDDIAAVQSRFPGREIRFSLNEAIDYGTGETAGQDPVFFSSRREFSGFLAAIYRKMRVRGISIPYPSINNFCDLIGRNGVIVRSDGGLGRCGVDFSKIGGTARPPDMETKFGPDPFRGGGCQECKFLPNCYGGCNVLHEQKKEKCPPQKYILGEILRLHVEARRR